ncbi:hypothetical protein L873DRAFT_341745 [Choiromyces venosus 120613-1]|uniref:Uncharacterized protein n=1 Tax=Choiromyces venosus 120613-1 TaxID=1336337 RepID=A0A3N4IY95_9PEZI|nr:hypothetical protein L873DRAFT_341745 [Choiromyces venosus 120613-1]
MYVSLGVVAVVLCVFLTCGIVFAHYLICISLVLSYFLSVLRSLPCSYGMIPRPVMVYFHLPVILYRSVASKIDPICVNLTYSFLTPSISSLSASTLLFPTSDMCAAYLYIFFDTLFIPFVNSDT